MDTRDAAKNTLNEGLELFVRRPPATIICGDHQRSMFGKRRAHATLHFLNLVDRLIIDSDVMLEKTMANDKPSGSWNLRKHERGGQTSTTARECDDGGI